MDPRTSLFEINDILAPPSISSKIYPNYSYNNLPAISVWALTLPFYYGFSGKSIE